VTDAVTDSAARAVVPGLDPTPDVAFDVLDAGVMPAAAAPILRLRLRVRAAPQVRIRSLVLTVQVRIAAPRRGYDEVERARLVELFGLPQQWASSLRSLLWTRTMVTVPAFHECTEVDLLVPCTYDLDVAATKYLRALEDGVVPLELLFSGSLFYLGEGGALRGGQLPWEKEATYDLPVQVWRDVMDAYFAGTAWLRLRHDVFDRLCAYKAARMLPTWEDTLESLLHAAREQP
jgi:hypothetical protein